MIIRNITFFFFFLIPPFAYSQAKDDQTSNQSNTKENKAYLGLSVGLSMPMGSFSAKNVQNTQSGFAKNGFNIHLLDFGYQLNESLSLKAFYLKTSNEIDEKLLGDALSRSSPNNYKVDASSYELNALLVGFGMTKQAPSADIDLHFLVGYGNSFLPSFQLIESTPQSNTQREINFRSTKESGFGAGINAGLRIHINSTFDFLTQASYIIFEKEFEQIRIENNITSTTASKLSYEIFTVNVGLAYHFNFKN